MKTLSLTLILITVSLGIFSQDFEIPKNYKLDKAEDYAAYEEDIIQCFNWLMSTPLNKQSTKRKEANKFLLSWVMGSPNVSIEINEDIVNFMGTSPELLVIFIGGWTKYSLETKDFENVKTGSLKGIESVIEFYTKNRDFIAKDKKIEKYIKLKNKGKLKSYIDKKA